MILRLSGPRAIEIAAALFTPEDGHGALSELPGHRHVPGRLHVEISSVAGCTAELPGRCYVMRAPRTYTREDIAELHLDAAPALTGDILTAAAAAGARIAEPGEFTRRAYLSGRLSLDAAEAVARMVGASTESEARAAARRLMGLRRGELDDLTERTEHLTALLEAALDFSDEEIEVVPRSQARAAAGELHAAAGALLKGARSEARTLAGTRVVLAGQPNAGKSSLLNRLAGRETALVSPRAGTTRDRLEAPVNLNGRDVLLIDTAGLEAEAKIDRDRDHDRDPIAALARDAARRALAEADVLLWVNDGVQVVSEADAAARAHEVAAFSGSAAILVLSKADLPKKADARIIEAAGRQAGLPLINACVRTSVVTGSGLETLAAKIAEVTQPSDEAASSSWQYSVELTAAETAAVGAAAEAIERACNVLDLESSPAYELAAADLHEALHALHAAGRGAAGHATDGAVITEALLDRIFAQFCIGK